MPETSAGNKDAPVTIKKYANRRLYNTATSSYVTLDHLCSMVKKGIDFVVYDAKTGDDITHSVLTQIIMEEESKGHNLLPISFLRQLISFYGDSLSGFVPRYLELSMETFARNQEQMRSYLEDAFGGFFPFKQIEEMGKTNMAMFHRAMEMFTPFSTGKEGAVADDGSAAGEAEPPGANEIAELKSRLNAMQRQLDEIARKGRK
jgi:polyhydroxyalkanoate synthesis repressor PhaR